MSTNVLIYSALILKITISLCTNKLGFCSKSQFKATVIWIVCNCFNCCIISWHFVCRWFPLFLGLLLAALGTFSYAGAGKIKRTTKIVICNCALFWFDAGVTRSCPPVEYAPVRLKTNAKYQKTADQIKFEEGNTIHLTCFGNENQTVALNLGKIRTRGISIHKNNCFF